MRRLSLIICLLAVSVALLTSCLNSEDPYRAGFVFTKPSQAVSSIFANNTVDSVVVYSYGKWYVVSSGGQTSWCTLGKTQGNAETINSIPVRFSQNTTGTPRSETFQFIDVNHPDDAHAAILFWQYATRGDGTLGSAADVKSISGSDGSHFAFTYDQLHRPTSLVVTQGEKTLFNLNLDFNDADSTLTVNDHSRTMKGRYGNDYQPLLLMGDNDTVGYYSQYYEGYLQMAVNQAFNIEHHRYGQPTKRYALLLNGQSLLPDSLHNADSLRIATDRMIENLKLTYSTVDNRRQSVDVNQLIFGTEQCDPYQLLSLFRYARNTSIISKAMKDGNGYIVEVELNSDGSVHTMTVKKSSGGTVLPDIPLTYTFEY